MTPTLTGWDDVILAEALSVLPAVGTAMVEYSFEKNPISNCQTLGKCSVIFNSILTAESAHLILGISQFRVLPVPFLPSSVSYIRVPFSVEALGCCCLFHVAGSVFLNPVLSLLRSVPRSLRLPVLVAQPSPPLLLSFSVFRFLLCGLITHRRQYIP